jgi:hypothetical protein
MFELKLWVSAVLFLGACPMAWAAGYDGKLTLSVTDEATGQPLAARMELRNSRGRPVWVKSTGAISRDGYVIFDGQITLELSQDSYRFFLEAGPEYHTRQGHFTLERHAEDATAITLKRHVNMAEHGWWAGDLDVHQRHEDLPLLMRAAGLSLATERVGSNVQGKCREQRVATDKLLGPRCWLDYRRGGGLLFLAAGERLDPGFDLCKLTPDGSSLSALDAAAQAGTDVVALTPDAWDLPLWVAADKLAAVQVIHRHALAGAAPGEARRPRDKVFFPGKLGSGRAGEAIYHHLLNCGLRIPPAGGSGAGDNTSPLGASRVYVHCSDVFSQEDWLAGFRAGRVVVTNGPLLRTSVEGQTPGYVFHLDRGQKRLFQIALSLSFYEQAPVEYLEIVKNGRVAHEVRLDQLAQQSGRLPPVEFHDSGWFLVRAVTNNPQTYQFASTGPYYVEAGYQPRISRASVEYFLHWLDEAAEKFADNEAVSADIAGARPFWKNLVNRANAD